jgi:hypothetical protein
VLLVAPKAASCEQVNICGLLDNVVVQLNGSLLASYELGGEGSLSTPAMRPGRQTGETTLPSWLVPAGSRPAPATPSGSVGRERREISSAVCFLG